MAQPTIVLTFVARRAGIEQANNAIATNNAATPTNDFAA